MVNKSNNIKRIISYLENLDTQVFPRKIDLRKKGPQMIVDHMALALGYPKIDKKGKSKYFFVQSLTGFTLQDIFQYNNITKKENLIEKLNDYLLKVRNDNDQFKNKIRKNRYSSC